MKASSHPDTHDVPHLIPLGVGHLLPNLCVTTDLGENAPFGHATVSELKKNRTLNTQICAYRSTDNKGRQSPFY